MFSVYVYIYIYVLIYVTFADVLSFTFDLPQIAFRFEKRTAFAWCSGAKDPGRVRLRFATPWLVRRVLR